MSETPRTDAVSMYRPYCDYVDSDFCRQLERELTTLKQQLAEKDVEIEELKKEIEKLSDADMFPRELI